MLNNPFVLQQAELWAKRVLAVPNAPRRSASRDVRGGVRPPADEGRTRRGVGFVAEQAKEYGKPDHPKAWADLAHVLFNAKEFIFVE